MCIRDSTADAFTALQVQSNGSRTGVGYSDGRNRSGYNLSSSTVASPGPTWVTTGGDPFGGSNTALYFDGTDYVSWASSADFNITANLTVEAWVKSDIDLSSSGHNWFSRSTSGSNQWIIGINSGKFTMLSLIHI